MLLRASAQHEQQQQVAGAHQPIVEERRAHEDEIVALVEPERGENAGRIAVGVLESVGRAEQQRQRLAKENVRCGDAVEGVSEPENHHEVGAQLGEEARQEAAQEDPTQPRVLYLCEGTLGTADSTSAEELDATHENGITLRRHQWILSLSFIFVLVFLVFGNLCRPFNGYYYYFLLLEN